MRPWAAVAQAALLLAVASLSVYTVVTIRSVGHEVRSTLTELKKYRRTSMSSSWTSGGTTHTVTTEPKSESEPFADLLDRHAERLAEAQQLFPPD